MNETEQLADYVAGLRFEDLSPEAVTMAKRAIRDTVGVAMFGRSLEWAGFVAEVGKDMTSDGPSSIWGGGWQTVPAVAALVNGTATKTIELDDRHHRLEIHNGSATIPAAIALAEQRGATGRDLILAVACGYEVAFRVARASFKRITKFYWVSIRNIWGAATASAKIIDLDKGGILNTLGIAGSMTSGLWAYRSDPRGTMVKSFQSGGWPSHSGVMAALVAEKGLTAPRTVLEDEYGVLRAFCSSEPDMDALVAGLGESFEMLNFETKAYATVGAYGPAVEAVANLLKEHGFDPGSVRSISIGTSAALVWHSGPTPPESIVAAENHLAFVTAAALWYDMRDPRVWHDAILTDERIGRLVASAEVYVDDDIDRIYREAVEDAGVRVSVVLDDGRSFTTWVRTGKGHAANPMTDEDIDEKFRLLASKSLAPAEVERLREYLLGLDSDDRPVSLAGFGSD